MLLSEDEVIKYLARQVHRGHNTIPNRELVHQFGPYLATLDQDMRRKLCSTCTYHHIISVFFCSSVLINSIFKSNDRSESI